MNKMPGKGKNPYVPPKVFEELEGIHSDYNIPKNKGSRAEAFKKMAELSRVGREIDNMRKRMVLADLWGNKKKR